MLRWSTSNMPISASAVGLLHERAMIVGRTVRARIISGGISDDDGHTALYILMTRTRHTHTRQRYLGHQLHDRHEGIITPI